MSIRTNQISIILINPDFISDLTCRFTSVYSQKYRRYQMVSFLS